MTLNVAKETELELTVEKEESGNNCTISCRLLSYGEPVPHKQVKILVNDTVRSVVETSDPNGNSS
jgi:hypothetical protein